ncbi:MAG: hypothetical protein K6G88_11810 [Lachnospiraceae bacterium]|nr:hypothetical protein [Lachnospiraceae bacterium]
MKMIKMSSNMEYKGFCIKEGFLVQKNEKDEIIAISSGFRIGEPTSAIKLFTYKDGEWISSWEGIEPFEDFFVVDEEGRDITEDYEHTNAYVYFGDRFNPKEGDIRENPIMAFDKHCDGETYRHTGRDIYQDSQWSPEYELIS